MEEANQAIRQQTPATLAVRSNVSAYLAARDTFYVRYVSQLEKIWVFCSAQSWRVIGIAAVRLILIINYCISCGQHFPKGGELLLFEDFVKTFFVNGVIFTKTC